VHVVQLTFLKLLSATAKQSFTYHCLNSAGWLDTAGVGHRRALRFRGSNGEELTHENAHYIDATYDGCQVGGGDTWTTGRDDRHDVGSGMIGFLFVFVGGCFCVFFTCYLVI
jgi:hypothetical protein